jgi:hypothetical protein
LWDETLTHWNSTHQPPKAEHNKTFDGGVKEKIWVFMALFFFGFCLFACLQGHPQTTQCVPRATKNSKKASCSCNNCGDLGKLVEEHNIFFVKLFESGCVESSW